MIEVRTRTRIPMSPSKTQVDWISTRDNRLPLPPYGKEVLLIRPNKTTGRNDVIMGRLEQAKPEGVAYGKMGDEFPRLTYDDYWVCPGRGIYRFDVITFWKEKPIPPPNY
jgi:hypothetical protein